MDMHYTWATIRNLWKHKKNVKNNITGKPKAQARK
jgi:hypothetical protein